jgi:hypothetical protein
MVSTIPVPLAPLQADAALGAGLLITFLLPLLIALVAIAGMWKVFTKAGEPGWAAIIPIYNVYKMIKISGNEWWWLILFIIPFINFIAAIKISIDVAKAFGQGVGFGLGLVFLSFVFWPLLGFGDYQYQGRMQQGGGRGRTAPA